MKTLIATLFFLLVTIVHCERILIAAPFGTRSHQNCYIPLIKALVERGHHLTLITNYEVKELQPMSNVQQIVLDLKVDCIHSDVFQVAIGIANSVSSTIKMIQTRFGLQTRVASTMYTDQRVLKLLNTVKFHMVMVTHPYGFTAYPLAWHFNATLAIISPVSISVNIWIHFIIFYIFIIFLYITGNFLRFKNMVFPGTAYLLGDSDHTEYVPNIVKGMTDRMNLPQRVFNTLYNYAIYMLLFGVQKASINSVAKTVLPNCPPLDDIEKEISLVFANSHPIFHYPRAKTPEMIEIGGIHCRTPQPLPPVSSIHFHFYHKFFPSSHISGARRIRR